MSDFAIEENRVPLKDGNDRKESDEKPDLLPEYCRYRDEGCDLAESCLNCPFTECIYDQPRGKVSRSKAVRNEQIIQVYKKGSCSLSELAERFNVSIRTVQRALAGRRKKNERH